MRYSWILLMNWLMFGLMMNGLPLTQADDWSQWRGSQRDGVWRETGIVEELPEGQIPITWSVEIGPGYSGPTVADGRVYVMDRQVDDRQLERILCFDAETGELQWSHSYEARYTIGYTAGPRASVTVERGMAYAVGAMGLLHCLDAATGQVVWAIDLADKYDIEMPIWGIAGSPLLYDNLVIQQVGGADGAGIVAFDRQTGNEVWRALKEAASYSSPVITQQAGKDVLVCWTAATLSGLDPLSGETYWSHPMPPSRMPIGIGTPSINNNLVFVSSFYDGSMMVRLDPDQLASELVWRAVGPDEQKTESLHAMIGTSLVRDGYVYGVDSYGQFRCLDAETGQRIWEDQSLVPKARWATIHMVQHDDDVWMFNERGELLIVQLSPQGLKILDRCQLIEPTTAQLNQRGGVCWSHPAFADRSVFARNDSRLVRASLAK